MSIPLWIFLIGTEPRMLAVQSLTTAFQHRPYLHFKIPFPNICSLYPRIPPNSYRTTQGMMLQSMFSRRIRFHWNPKLLRGSPLSGRKCSVSSVDSENAGTAPVPLKDLPSSTIYLYEDRTKTHIYLVGTFHLSKISADDVRSVIRAARPRAVMIELCPDRYVQMFGNRSAINHNASTVHRTGSQILVLRRSGNTSVPKSGTLRIGKALSGIYSTYRHSGVAVGGEFNAAQEEATRLGSACHLVLGDMDAKETLDKVKHRVLRALFSALTPTRPCSWPMCGVAPAGAPKG